MSFWHDSKVLVTGANGFGGASLCKQLVEKEAKVFALVRDNSNLLNLKDILPKINLVYGDIRYPETIESAIKEKEFVFNLAAKVNIEETRKNPNETLRTNVNGAYNVANICKKYGVKRLIHVSTCHVYGNSTEDLPTKEDVTPHPIDVYSISKFAGELLANNIHQQGMDVVITRAFNHYGPGQTGDFFIAKVIRYLLNNVQPRLGGGSATRDYSYVDDITRGYLLAAEKGRSGEIYHFASGKEMSIKDLYEEIREIIESPISAVWESPRQNDMSRSVGDSRKANTDLGWSPQIPLDEGLRLTVNWWKANGAPLGLDLQN